MNISLNTILSYLKKMNFEYKYFGKNDISINGYSSLKNLKDNSITWIKNQSYYDEKFFVGLEDVLLVVKSDININSIYFKMRGLLYAIIRKKYFFQY